MTFIYDPETDEGKVRLLARENKEETHVLEDADISAFLVLNSNNIRLAAADALDHIADDQVLLLKKVGLGGGALTTDGPAVADALRKHAAILRAQDAEINFADEGFEIVEWPLSRSSRRDFVRHNLL